MWGTRKDALLVSYGGRVPCSRGHRSSSGGLLTQVQMQAKNRTKGLGYHNGRVAKVGEIDHEER